MRLLVPSIVALVPLLITPGYLFRFDITPKIAILLLGVSLMLLFCKQNVRNVRGLLGTGIGRGFVVLLVAQWLSTALSTALSLHPALSLNGSSWRSDGLLTDTALILFALLVAGWLASGRENIRTLLRAATASGAVTALYGIAQYCGWDPLLSAKAYQAGEGVFTIVRPPGTLGHANYFAAWLIVVVFFGVALEGLEDDRWRKRLAIGVSILAAVAIVLSGTRSALLGLGAGGIALLAFRHRKIGIRALALAATFAAAFTVLWFSPAGLKLRARVHWSVEDLRGGARLPLWRDSLRMANSRLPIGFGPETFTSEFPRFESVELARAYPDFYHESPHNVFLDALTEEGIGGFLVLFGLFGLGFYAHARSRSNLSDALVCGLLGMLVCHQFSVFIVPTAMCFFLLLAMLATMTPAESPELNTARALPRRLVIALSAAASLLLAFYAVRLVVADRALAIAGHQIESGDAQAAARAYAAAVRWHPEGSGADLDYSRSMAQLASRTQNFAIRLEARTEAMRAGVRAARVAEDRQNAWYNLAILLAGQGDTGAVERSLHNAIAWAPNWFKPHWTLAQLLELTGRHKQALAEAAAAVERDGGHDAQVSETLRKLAHDGTRRQHISGTN
ncbi:MAG TPA: O-antigen ligase family protein [Bryobacteraceae bacterium]|nr:O-antigen ligase family protein [Bryobacteraceae bacterium]